MSKKYEKLARDIMGEIGGAENISTLTHCYTRLRFVLNSNSKADQEAIKALEGVINVIESGGQFQVVIGPHVSEVYEEIMKDIDPSVETNTKSIEKDKVGIFSKVIDFVSGSFGPVVPALAGAGMIKAVLALIILFEWISNESQTYYVMNFMADAAFYFLPFLLAYGTAMKIKCSPILAMVLAGIILHPNLSQLVAAGEAVSIFGIPLRLVSYGSSVVPILLIVLVQSYIERNVRKFIPDSVKIMFVPMITLIITGILALTILGPLGAFIGDYLAQAFIWMGSYGGWIITFVIAAFFPLMVMLGLHYGLVPLSIAQFATLGYENLLGPGALISNIAQGVAAMVVGVTAKDKSTKAIGTSTGITGLMGITEPALYGVNMPKKYPLIAAIIGGGSGGLYAGLMGVSRNATGVTGLPSIPLYIGENMWHLYNVLIALVITVIVTAVLTFFLGLKYEKAKTINEDKTIKVKDTVIANPIKGEMVELRDVKDQAFASGAMGKGVAIEPSEGKVIAPFNGEVLSLFPTKHAIGLLSDEGVEVLIHVGLNTVELNGKYFEAYVEQGQRIKKGQTLLTFDLENIKREGYITQTPIIVTNTNIYSDIIANHSNQNIDFNNELLVIKA